MDDGLTIVAILALIVVGYVFGIVTVNIIENHAVRVDSTLKLHDLSSRQINEINTYLTLNYPDNVVQTTDEKTTIIYVYQNGTQPTGACKT